MHPEGHRRDRCALEPMIEAKSHHPAQSLATFRQEGFPAPGIPLGGQSQPLVVFIRFLGHRGDHALLVLPWSIVHASREL